MGLQYVIHMSNDPINSVPSKTSSPAEEVPSSIVGSTTNPNGTIGSVSYNSDGATSIAKTSGQNFLDFAKCFVLKCKRTVERWGMNIRDVPSIKNHLLHVIKLWLIFQIILRVTVKKSVYRI